MWRGNHSDEFGGAVKTWWYDDYSSWSVGGSNDDYRVEEIEW